MLARDSIEADVAGVAFADAAADLSAIHRPDCAAVIWRRSLAADVQSWIDALAPAQLPDARVVVRPRDVGTAVAEICDACRTPACAERDMLADDIAALADVFAEAMAARYLRLRLEVVVTNSCRKFHIDNVKARLICAYRGTGTQYGAAIDEADPQRIEVVQTGAPILLRGKKWPTHPISNLRHRSPPIEGTGETRLLLVLDPVWELDETRETLWPS